jgi:hypothetical protein
LQGKGTREESIRQHDFPTSEVKKEYQRKDTSEHGYAGANVKGRKTKWICGNFVWC